MVSEKKGDVSERFLSRRFGTPGLQSFHRNHVPRECATFQSETPFSRPGPLQALNVVQSANIHPRTPSSSLRLKMVAKDAFHTISSDL